MGKASRKRSAKPVKPAATLEGDGTTPELEEEVDEDVAEVETEKIVINLGDMEAGKWARAKMDAEVRRLDSMGQKSIIMKTMKLFVEHDTEAESYTNCIEVEGDFDFDLVTQILLSDSEPCPAKPGYSLLKVVAFTEMDKPPILLPYLYDATAVGNKLNIWAFINSNDKRSVHQVDNFSEVEAPAGEAPREALGTIAEEAPGSAPANDLD